MVSSGGFGVANKEYLSMDSIPEEAKNWVVDPSKKLTIFASLDYYFIIILGSSPYAHADSNLRSILVTGNREPRQKKSLTIVNHLAVEEEINSDHEVTEI